MVEPRSSTSGSTKPSSRRTCKPRRRALLIGYVGGNKEGQSLHNPHRDAIALRDTLIELYGYQARDITMMLDDYNTLHDPQQSGLVPSRDNLLREMRKLVVGARPGDMFFFYYSGHGVQIESESRDEEDGFDEAIIPYAPDGMAEPILDDDLRHLLVEPLPPGACLTAIFDSCCSGTLLDLEHYACNNVYVPWVNRGKRDIYVTRRAFLRHATLIHDSLQKRLELKLSNQASVTKNAVPHTNSQSPQQPRVQFHPRARSQPTATAKPNPHTAPSKETRRRTLLVPIRARTHEAPRRRGTRFERRPRRAGSIPVRGDTVWVHSLQYDEPESYLRCDGFSCRSREEETKPYVISLSACQDGEQTWDTTKGTTFTQAIIRLLNLKPDMALRQLAQQAGFIMYEETTLKLHRWSKAQLKRSKADLSPDKVPPPVCEIFNSPRPQIGSTYFLGPDEPFRA